MKKLIVISGPIGIGKSSVAREMLKNLNNSVILDGDQIVYSITLNKDTEDLEENNIMFLLNAYLQSVAYENILFVWSRTPKQIEETIGKLDNLPQKIIRILLTGSECALTTHLLKDFSLDKIELGEIKNIVSTIGNFKACSSYLTVDVSGTSVEKITSEIFESIK